MRLRLFRDHSRGSVTVPRAPSPAARITLRLATAEDGEAIGRLAELYDRPLPTGPLLLAEVDGELQAALTLTDAQELMDPYLPTAALVELLALRAEQLRDQWKSHLQPRPAQMRVRTSGSARSRSIAHG
jgi:hypothetical protein